MARHAEATDLIGAKNPQMIQKILYEIVSAYGFHGQFDVRVFCVEKDQVSMALSCLVLRMKKLLMVSEFH